MSGGAGHGPEPGGGRSADSLTAVAAQMTTHIEVVAAPAQALIVDEGRHGWAHLAVTRAGAYDRRAFARANRLVGNAPGAAAIEYVLGPLTLRFHGAATVAVSGVAAQVQVLGAGRSLSRGTEETITVPAGALLSITLAEAGLRGYIAVRGGIDAPTTLGSRSSDTLSGLGPAPLRSGGFLARGTATADFPAAGRAVGDLPGARPDRGHVLDLRLLPAPRSHLLRITPDELAALRWTVSPESNRVGLRLAGTAVGVEVAPSAASEPLVRGAVQVPPDGQPVIMGPDHPTTGGYPVVGVVAAIDSDALAQARPGGIVRLVPAGHGRLA